MRRRLTTALLLGAVLALALPAHADPVRQDVIWARSTAGQHITLDGVMDEPAWAQAQSWTVRYGVDNGLPGSGWQEEGGRLAKDSTNAVLKFLVDGNKLYLGASVRDSSVGGSVTFNANDGVLMAIKDHLTASRPAPVSEYFYSWWWPEDTLHAGDPGRLPCFRGRWGGSVPCGARSPDTVAIWNAATRVHGLSNSDAVLDTSWTFEMVFDLTAMGYDVTQAGGDIIEWNISIYDCDWYWPLVARFSANRGWWQGPWGNAAWYDEVKIYARPDVTINSGAVPVVGPEVRVANIGDSAPPKIDGYLTESVWAHAPAFDIRWDDSALRLTYPGTGPWRSGQFQPDVNGGKAPVLDGGDATVKWFFKDDTLYFGFDVRDQVVQYVNLPDRYDGLIVTLTDRVVRWRDHNLEDRKLTFIVGPDGREKALDYLPFLRDTALGARVALRLKPNTVLDTVGDVADEGYTAELAVDLTKLGYPHGLGDGALWVGIDLMDGDSQPIITNSYGTRTWWFREREHECCPAAAYLDPALRVLGVETGERPLQYALMGNSPNPFRTTTTLKFSLSEASEVAIEVFDLQGRRVTSRSLGVQPAGVQRVPFTHPGLRTGLYLYRLRMLDPASHETRASLAGKMMLVN